MKFVLKTIFFAVLIAALAIPLCSCEKIKGFFDDKEIGNSLQDGLDDVGMENNNNGKNRESRIEGALAKAKDTQKAYNMNRSLQGMEAQPDGTKYVVEANGYYIEFTVKNGNLEDTNQDEIPTKDPYSSKKKKYKKVTGELVEGIRKDVTKNA